jgi:hypothetical protein
MSTSGEMMKDHSNSGRRNFIKLAGGGIGLAALSYYLGISGRRPLMPPPSQLPDYMDSNLGFPVFRGPYLQKDVNLAAFVFHADLESLKSHCDRTLNSPEPVSYKYIPLMSNVIMVYADMLVSSLDERDVKIGFIPETEVSFWLLTLAMQKTSNGYIPHHLAWHLPYLLVDESNSIASGREVYGFNKLGAEFTKPKDILTPEFSTDVLGIKKFDPTSIAQKERLLVLNRIPEADNSQGASKDWAALMNAFSGMLMSNFRPDLNAGIIEFAAHALLDNIPLVFLKQFRDSSDTKKAVYKSLVEAPIRVSEFREGALFPGNFSLNINHLDSHPVAKLFGLIDKQDSKFSAWIKVNFVLEKGIEFK